MQPRRERQVTGFAVVLVPEAARQAVHQAHGASGEFVAGGLTHQFVQRAVEPHEGHVVGLI